MTLLGKALKRLLQCNTITARCITSTQFTGKMYAGRRISSSVCLNVHCV